MDKRELLAAMRDGRERFQAVFATLDDDAFSAPNGFSSESGWSYKDLLGHIGYWEERAALIFVHLLEGKVPQKTAARWMRSTRPSSYKTKPWLPRMYVNAKPWAISACWAWWSAHPKRTCSTPNASPGRKGCLSRIGSPATLTGITRSTGSGCKVSPIRILAGSDRVRGQSHR